MKSLISISLFLYTTLCFATTGMPDKSQASDPLVTLMQNLSTMSAEQRQSPAVKQKVEALFIETCLDGARQSANKDVANGEMSTEEMESMMLMVKSKCVCVVKTPGIIAAIYKMADRDPTMSGEKFQSIVMGAMNQCLQQ